MAAITSAGVGSGLDIEGLVSKLVTAEGQPTVTRLNTQEVALQADLSAYGSLKGALSSFQTSVQALKEPSAFKVRTATSSNPDLFTVTAGSAAVSGSFSIVVDQLAQAAKVRSGDFSAETEVVGEGSLTIGLGSSSFNIAVGADMTLAGLRDAINSATDNPGLKAAIIKVDTGSQLVLTSEKVGAANTVSITANDVNASDGKDLTRLAAANLTTVQSAQDAIIHIDGQQVTRDSNSFSDAITGVTLSLVKADPATTGKVTIAMDKSSVTSKLNEFIKSYNSLVKTMSNLSSYNAATQTGGPLLGDATLRGVQNQLRQVLSGVVQGGGSISALADIGIVSDKTGNLQLDSAKLDKAMTANFDAIANLFSSENGLAKKFDSTLKEYLASDGPLSSRLNGVNKSIADITDQRKALDVRLTALESRYRKQFTAMDALVAQLQSTGSFLTQQLDSLPGVVAS
jgi:flagellar hook-associated protein 2